MRAFGRTIVVVAAILVALGLTACGSKSPDEIYEESIVRESAPYEAVDPVAKRERHPKVVEATSYSVDVCHYEDQVDPANRNAYCFVSFQGYPGDPLNFCHREYKTDLDGSKVSRGKVFGCSHFASDEIAKLTHAEAEKR